MKRYHKRIRNQILEAMEAGVEIKTAEIVARVDGARQKVNAELSALVEAGKIEKGISRVSGRFVNWRKPSRINTKKKTCENRL